MRIDLDILREAVRRGVVTTSEASTLWSHLETRRADAAGARLTAVAERPEPPPPAGAVAPRRTDPLVDGDGGHDRLAGHPGRGPAPARR